MCVDPRLGWQGSVYGGNSPFSASTSIFSYILIVTVFHTYTVEGLKMAYKSANQPLASPILDSLFTAYPPCKYRSVRVDSRHPRKNAQASVKDPNLNGLEKWIIDAPRALLSLRCSDFSLCHFFAVPSWESHWKRGISFSLVSNRPAIKSPFWLLSHTLGCPVSVERAGPKNKSCNVPFSLHSLHRAHSSSII